MRPAVAEAVLIFLACFVVQYTVVALGLFALVLGGGFREDMVTSLANVIQDLVC